MARPQEANVGQRQVINTIEDTSKYQTGDARRLRVIADPLKIYETPQTSQLTALTEALSSVKPELMNYAINKKAEAYKLEIELGQRKAQTGEIAQGEMEKFGYDNIKAVNDWTDWNQQVLQEYDQQFDKENGDVEAFMKAKWEANPFADKSADYVNKFTPLAGKTMEKIRTAQGTFKAEQQEALNNVELTRMFKSDIVDVMGGGMDYSTEIYESRRAELKAMFPGKTHSQLDEFAFQAVLTTAQEAKDVSLFKVFKQPHADGTPGLYEIPKWKDMIDKEVNQIISEKVTATARAESVNEKALNNAGETIGRKAMMSLIDLQSFDDPTLRDAKIAEVFAEIKKATELGIPVPNTYINAVYAATKGIDKKQETEYQAQTYTKLRLMGASPSVISQRYAEGDLSLSGFDKLMNKHEQAAQRAEKGSDEKSVTTNSFYKDGEKSIKKVMGFATGLQAAMNPKKVTEDTNAALVDYKEVVEAYIDEGLPVKDAAIKAQEVVTKRVTDAGLQSKAFEEARAKLQPEEAKRKYPASYYKSKPEEYLKDNASKTVPSMTPKELLEVQRRAKAHAVATNKLKNRESTK